MLCPVQGMNSLNMAQIYLDDTIYYHVDEAGRGEPVVLLHGFTGSTQTWFPVWDRLTKYFRVIAIDLPGHGQSFMPSSPHECEFYTVAEDLYAVFGDLGLATFHLLGYSLGGRMALYFAASYPPLVKTLILESASPGLRTEDERLARRNNDNAQADMIERSGIAAFVDYWQNLPLWGSQKKLPDDIRSWLRALRLKNHPQGLANSLRGAGTGVQPSLWERLPELDMPTLLITGELDTKYTAIAQQMAAALPRSRLALIPGAGHCVHLEKPEIYAQLIRDFLHQGPEIDITMIFRQAALPSSECRPGG